MIGRFYASISMFVWAVSSLRGKLFGADPVEVINLQGVKGHIHVRYLYLYH